MGWANFSFSVFLIEDHRSYQKLFTELKNIAHSLCYCIFKYGKYISRLSQNPENTYRDYLKMQFFELKNLSPPTLFEERS